MKANSRHDIVRALTVFVITAFAVVVSLSGYPVGAGATAVAEEVGEMEYCEEPHRSFLGGPWELVVMMGMEGRRLHFPITVSNECKPDTLGKVLPVMGTPIKIGLERYVPDLKRETTAVEDPEGGMVAKLAVKGDGLDQTVWLSSTDPGKRSTSASVGGVELRELHNPETAEDLVRQLARDGVVGVVSVWLEGADLPVEFAVELNTSVRIPGTDYTLSFLDYLPHYSIDLGTGKVLSRSDQPVNPALKIRLKDGERVTERWVWSKFPGFHHNEETLLPLRVEFSDYTISPEKGEYIVVAATESQRWLLFTEKGKTRVEKAALNRPYPFRDKAYSFSIEEIRENAVVKTSWKNNSESLLHPAIIARLEYDDTVEQVVLQFGKPYHHKMGMGTLVLLFRRRQEPAKGAAEL